MRPGKFDLRKRARYPHMGREDAEVWNRWLGSLAETADGVDYDVRVGPGVPVPEDTPDDMRSDWSDLTRLRIDAVVYLPTITLLVEVKPRLIPSALGQLLAYSYWFQREDSSQFPIKLVALVGRSDAQLEPVFRRWLVDVVRA